MVSPNSDMRSAPPSRPARNLRGSYTEYTEQRIYNNRGQEIYEADEIEYGEIAEIPTPRPRDPRLSRPAADNYYIEDRSPRELRAEEEFIHAEEAFDENMFDISERPAEPQRRRVPAPFVDNANEIVDKRPLSPDFDANRRRTQKLSRPIQNNLAAKPQNPNPRTDFPEEKKASKIVSFLVVLAVIVVGAAVGAASYFFFFDR
jgi:hypothetical protein